MADKKEMHYFVLPEYEEEENYLCEMAKKGYLFEKVTMPGVYYFTKGEPTDMIYRLDFNPQKGENREEYLQMYRDYGWEYIQDLNEFSYFRKLNDGSEEEIFSDNASRIDMMERVYRRKMLPLLVIFLCCVVPQGHRMAEGAKLDDPLSLAFYFLWVVLMLLYIYIIVRCTRGFRRLKKKYGEV